MKKGIDRVVNKINEVYDYAQKELEIIPYWIVYRIEYTEYITRGQIEMAHEGAHIVAKSIGVPVESSAIVNVPLDFDEIRNLLKTNSFEEVKWVLKHFKQIYNK